MMRCSKGRLQKCHCHTLFALIAHITVWINKATDDSRRAETDYSDYDVFSTRIVRIWILRLVGERGVENNRYESSWQTDHTCVDNVTPGRGNRELYTHFGFCHKRCYGR